MDNTCSVRYSFPFVCKNIFPSLLQSLYMKIDMLMLKLDHVTANRSIFTSHNSSRD